MEYVKEEVRLPYLLECLQKTPPPVLIFAGEHAARLLRQRWQRAGRLRGPAAKPAVGLAALLGSSCSSSISSTWLDYSGKSVPLLLCHPAGLAYTHMTPTHTRPTHLRTENKRDVDHIHEFLLVKGVEAVAVHGSKDQEEREKAIDTFKAGKSDVLIATGE